MTSNEIRQKFLDFFASKGHQIVPSAPMVVKNDPTLMFTNAGMNQFKDIFLGNVTPKTHRATDSQKCLRVSGKHNDLEEVGHDSYHHTMFEMLGNWSFGDYFKTEAITWAWELLTDVYKIDKTKLYATVFEGSKEDGTSMDEEAHRTWLKFLPEDHILLGNKHDNFWEMGDTGPCGPCSEIHIDLRSDEEIAAVPGRDLVNKSNPLVIEIWNLVFMQYNRKANGELELLPNHNIDTGMGFERLCMVLQGKKSNYDTDVFTGMIHKIEELSGHQYHESENTEVAMRVIADHIRAISFSIADGQLPSNVKAGYVIRRILRRAVRYGYTFLGFDEPFLCRLVQQLADDMGGAYPELREQKNLIESVIREEEFAFLRTLDRGIRLMDDYLAKSADTKVISGKDAFVLYDTYGFPIDLTELIASEKGYTVDLEEFNAELQKQKDRARQATSNEFGDWIQYHNGEEEEFLGYDYTDIDGVSLIKQRTVKQKNKVMYQLVFDRTPFYAEMGGQVGDTGYIESESGERINILNTVKENNLTIHIAERIPSDCSEPFSLHVDADRRLKITNNHTTTHLLDQALREVLGTHVEQKGSFVCPDYLRFDFSALEKLSAEQLSAVEKEVNEKILEALPEVTEVLPIEEASKLGAEMEFEEKYGEKVRVVEFGDYSREFCAGTHVSNSSEIGLFVIESEGAVSSGVRRIQARTSAGAYAYLSKKKALLDEAKKTLNALDSELVGKEKSLLETISSQSKELASLKQKMASDSAKKLGEQMENVGGVSFLCQKLDKAERGDLLRLGDSIKGKEKDFFLFFAGKGEKGVSLLIQAGGKGAEKLPSGAAMKLVAPLLGGNGGGKPEMASGSAKSLEKFEEAVDLLRGKLQ